MILFSFDNVSSFVSFVQKKNENKQTNKKQKKPKKKSEKIRKKQNGVTHCSGDITIIAKLLNVSICAFNNK
jgi:uncharacterized membrane protein YkgB